MLDNKDGTCSNCKGCNRPFSTFLGFLTEKVYNCLCQSCALTKGRKADEDFIKILNEADPKLVEIFKQYQVDTAERDMAIVS